MTRLPATPCCKYEAHPKIGYPVYWNEFNKVVQCHNCGHIYSPVTAVKLTHPILFIREKPEVELRKSFEQWISAPPFECDIARNPNDGTKTVWPGQYCSYKVHLAWQAWEESSKRLKPNPLYTTPAPEKPVCPQDPNGDPEIDANDK